MKIATFRLLIEDKDVVSTEDDGKDIVIKTVDGSQIIIQKSILWKVTQQSR